MLMCQQYNADAVQAVHTPSCYHPLSPLHPRHRTCRLLVLSLRAPQPVRSPRVAPAPLLPTRHLLLADPFKHRLVTKNILPETLDHTNSLPPEVFHRPLHKVHIAIEDPVVIFRSQRCTITPIIAPARTGDLHRCNSAPLLFPLSFEHVNH